jgi:hypothetical protein
MEESHNTGMPKGKTEIRRIIRTQLSSFNLLNHGCIFTSSMVALSLGFGLTHCLSKSRHDSNPGLRLCAGPNVPSPSACSGLAHFEFGQRRGTSICPRTAWLSVGNGAHPKSRLNSKTPRVQISAGRARNGNPRIISTLT